MAFADYQYLIKFNYTRYFIYYKQIRVYISTAIYITTKFEYPLFVTTYIIVYLNNFLQQSGRLTDVSN